MAERTTAVRHHPRVSRRHAAAARRQRRASANAPVRGRARANARARHPASNLPAKGKPASPRVRRRRTILGTVMLGLTVIALLFAFVYPTSTFFRQRAELGKARERLARLEAETKRLERESERLRGDTEIERIAREQYGLVRPGEQLYAFVPETTTTAPAVGSTSAQP